MQTTDKKVNTVTPALFQLVPDAAALAAAQQPAVEAIIRPVGLAPTKSKNIIRTAQLLVERHAGQVPDTFDELEALPGVGHKTASVVIAHCFGCAQELDRRPDWTSVQSDLLCADHYTYIQVGVCTSVSTQ